MLPSQKFRLIMIWLICLLVIVIAQPVNAGSSMQTVPTAGPRPTQEVVNTPDSGQNPTAPAPTAVLATPRTGGLQPSPTPTFTQTLPATATAEGSTAVAADTATAVPATATEAPRAISTNAPESGPVSQATQAALPTLPGTAVAAQQTSNAAVWCFPIGALILVVLIVILFNWVRSWRKNP